MIHTITRLKASRRQIATDAMADENEKKKPNELFGLILNEPLLKGVAETARPEVRWIIAKDPTTPQGILKELAGDKDYGVRANVAGNENTPKEALSELSKSDEWVTRSNVAANPNAPDEVLKRLAADPIWVVRKNVAANPKAGVALRKELAADADEHVRLEAGKGLTVSEPQVMIARQRSVMPAMIYIEQFIKPSALKRRARKLGRPKKASKKAKKAKKAGKK